MILHTAYISSDCWSGTVLNTLQSCSFIGRTQRKAYQFFGARVTMWADHSTCGRSAKSYRIQYRGSRSCCGCKRKTRSVRVVARRRDVFRTLPIDRLPRLLPPRAFQSRWKSSGARIGQLHSGSLPPASFQTFFSQKWARSVNLWKTVYWWTMGFILACILFLFCIFNNGLE